MNKRLIVYALGCLQFALLQAAAPREVRGPNAWIEQPEEKSSKKEKGPLPCPVDVAPGFRVFALTFDFKYGLQEQGFWDKLTLAQRDQIERAGERGFVGVRNQENKFLVLAFGVALVDVALEWPLHDVAQEIMERYL